MRERFDAWLVIDPALVDLELRAQLSQMIEMVRSDWSELVPLDLSDQSFLRFVSRHRVSTLIPLSSIADEQLEEFHERMTAIQVAQMRIQATAIDVLSRLNDAGIESRVMKGLASAELDYPQPEFRHTGDVDIAVRPADMKSVVQVLSEARYRRRPRKSKNIYVVKGATLDGPLSVEVDVHDRLFTRSRYGDELFNDPGVALASLPGRAFSDELRLVNAAGSFALTPNGHKRLSGLIDVMRILDRGRVDVPRAIEIARSLRVGRVVGGVLAMQAVCSERTVDGRWPQPGWLDRQIRFGSDRRLVLEKLGRFRNMPLHAVPGYLPEWLAPDERERQVLRQWRSRQRTP